MTESYKQLVDKLKAFINRYYFLRLLKSFQLTISMLLLLCLFFITLEYYLFLSPGVKLFIISIYAVLVVFGFIFGLFLPVINLLGFFRNLKLISASELIANRFNIIGDRLKNILELAEVSSKDYSDRLIWASIDQKINQIGDIDFRKAILLKELKYHFFIFLVTVTFSGFIFFFHSSFIEVGFYRLENYKTVFNKPATYSFVLKSTDLKVKRGSSFKIEVACVGSKIPDVLYLSFGGNNFLMDKSEEGTFSYVLDNLNQSFLFHFTDLKSSSEIYKLEVLPEALIKQFSLIVIPPDYTSQKKYEVKNIGDIKVPYGSIIKWVFTTSDADSLFLKFEDSIRVAALCDGNVYTFEKQFFKDSKYHISLSNKYFTNENILQYQILITPDLYPSISVVQAVDSVNYQTYYFKGKITDDYGFHSLSFHLKLAGQDSIIELPFVKNQNEQNFYYAFNFNSLKGKAKEISYYFSVYDNDVFGHFKQAISETFIFDFPDVSEMVKKENSTYSEMDAFLQKGNRLAEDIRKSINDLKMKQINDKNLSDWEKSKMVEEIIQKKSQLENILEKLNEKNQDLNNYLSSFSDQKKEILEKQKQIEELLENVMNDELKKLFDEFNELAKNFDSRKFEQLSEKMKMSMDDLSEQLDRNLQMLKRMQIEQKLERIILQLNDLENKEKDNRLKINGKISFDDLTNEEKGNRDLLNLLKAEYDAVLELNKGLSKPMNLIDFSEDFKKIEGSFSETISQLEKGNRKRAGEQMNKNMQQINTLAFSMNQMLKMNQNKENSENIDDLKQLLENILYISVNQENILFVTKRTDSNDPAVKNLRSNQFKLINQAKMVKDSLYALSKRTPSLSGIINKEVLDMESQMNNTLDLMNEGRSLSSTTNQQLAITAANNLALFLNEALENIEKQMENAMPGDGDCDKPGGKGKKPSMNMLKQAQQSLKEQLEQMIEQMKNGDSKKMSQSIGKTLAQQEIMQQLIQELLNGNSVGSQTKEQLRAIDRLLEQNKSDLVNKNIGSQLIKRQNQVMNKLLQAEKAEMERGYEDERESKTARQDLLSNPANYFEYKNEYQNQHDLLNRTSYKLKLFYDQKYKNYLNELKN
jgi:hypothetical protein